jgi:hypothetical protein
VQAKLQNESITYQIPFPIFSLAMPFSLYISQKTIIYQPKTYLLSLRYVKVLHAKPLIAYRQTKIYRNFKLLILFARW